MKHLKPIQLVGAGLVVLNLTTFAAIAQAASASAVQGLCAEIRSGPVHLAKVMPAQAVVGEEFAVELRATAVECAADVVVTDYLPSGFTCVRSEPAAALDSDKLSWKLGAMDAGQTVSLRLWVKASQEGTLVNCATVAAVPRVCAKAVVGKPLLTLKKTGPASAMLGADVNYTIVVSNTGSAVARNVVVIDAVPEGMSGKPLRVAIGDLAPDQSRTIPVTFKANKTGKIVNTAVAESIDGGRVEGKVEADDSVVIQRQGVKITKQTAHKQLLIGKVASYDIVVINTGDTTLTGVVVSDTAAPGTTIITADGGAISGNTATWNIGELASGASKNLTVKVVSRTPGEFCDTASVVCAQGLRDSAQDCTTWQGVTGVLLEMVDDPDPIPVGDTSKYTIRVTNQGTTRAIEQLKIVVTIPNELELVPGSASDGAVVSGKTISWPVVPTLAPRAVVTRTYIAKGVTAGDARSKVSITTLLRQEPIEKFESTTVY